MTHTRHITMAGAVLVGVAALSSAARATGPGVRAGELLFHPRLTLAAGFDDNYYQQSSDAGLADSPDSASDASAAASVQVLKIGGGVSASNRAPNKVAFELESDFMLRFLSVDNNGATPVEDAGIGVDVAFLPRSPVTIGIVEDLSYRERPSDRDAAEGFQKLDNKIGADLSFRPGDRPEVRALEMQLGYRFHAIRFLDNDSTKGSLGARRGEKDAHEGMFQTVWKFLPKTALVLDLRMHTTDYPLVDGDEQDRDATPFYGQVGVRGLVTRRLSVVLRGGYANTFNAEGESYSGPIGKTEILYIIEPSLALTLGYAHDASDSGFSNYYVVDRTYGKGELFFLGTMGLNVALGFDYYDYSVSGSPVEHTPVFDGPRVVGFNPSTSGSGEPTIRKRKDPILRASVGFTYQPRDWVDVALTWQFERNSSDYIGPPVQNANDAVRRSQSSASFQRHVVLASVAAEY